MFVMLFKTLFKMLVKFISIQKLEIKQERKIWAFMNNSL